jgi:hypothetical protein
VRERPAIGASASPGNVDDGTSSRICSSISLGKCGLDIEAAIS